MASWDDPARDPARPSSNAEPWAAESPFVGETAEEQARIDPWYEAHTPFVEGRGPVELEGDLVVREELLLQRPSSKPPSLPQDCQKTLKSMKRPPSVAVVGAGMAGLMAARELGQQGIKVTVFEARSQVGGRVLSNTKFSNGRITEEGAELIGSFHTTWLALARKYGLAMVSRMDKDLYERESLDVKLTLDRPLSMDEIKKLDEAMEKRVLEPIARLASQIQHPSQPWLEPWLEQYDKMSVADALARKPVARDAYGIDRSERLWKYVEFKLVNDEVAPLDDMNFLGLLCKVKAGQSVRFLSDGTDPKPSLMRYWNELEIFRCADGCQALATRMADEIRTKYGANLRTSKAVTHIAISKQGVGLGVKEVKRDGTLADGQPVFIPGGYDYVILAIPPSVWDGVKITTADRRDPHPKDGIGLISMNPAVKFFSDVKKRFWIEEKHDPNSPRGSAPSGGSSTIGQVWEGTDNQTRAGNQGIVLSVFAGPIVPIPLVPGKAPWRAPNPGEFDKGLRQLYRGYTRDNLNRTRFADWPNVPFIMTGYASPTKEQIFKIVRELNKPWHGRLFFAGEHTRMDFFGYMEGALRSGEDAAKRLMMQACGLLKDPTPTSPSPPVRIASAAPIRAKTASEHETDILVNEHLSAAYPGDAESLFVGEPEEQQEPRAAALVYESPRVGSLEERWSGLDEDRLEEEEAPDELEGEEEVAAEDVLEGLQEEQIAPWAAGIDPFPAAPTVAFDVNDDRMIKAFAPVTVSTVTHLCTALVDLTGDPTTPPYAGVHDGEMISAGSLPKIYAMYAAFALRARVQAFVDAAAANGAPVVPPGITNEIEKAWKPKLRALFPARPANSFGNNQDVTFPKLGQILTFSTDGKVGFKRASPPLTDARIDRIGGSGAPEGMFHDWMRSMLRWSNNTAASKCILALGYFYLNGALARAGLFEAAAGRGLWLSADYKSHDWVKTEADRQANSAGPLLAPRWATVQRRRRSNITATAAQVARFMTLLARNKLVDAAASHDMRALMRADAGGLGSDANDALRKVGRDPTSVAAKFGRGDDGFNHECAIIERTVAGKPLRYVAIGLGSAPKRKHKDLFDLFVLLDEAIVMRNK